MVSSAVISYKGVWDLGSRNWLWNREALEGFLSELVRFRPCIGSINCWAADWALCTRFERLNMVMVTRPWNQPGGVCQFILEKNDAVGFAMLLDWCWPRKSGAREVEVRQRRGHRRMES